MPKIFGKASDFYRARILTLEEEIPPDFDWRDDVLYRSQDGRILISVLIIVSGGLRLILLRVPWLLRR